MALPAPANPDVRDARRAGTMRAAATPHDETSLVRRSSAGDCCVQLGVGTGAEFRVRLRRIIAGPFTTRR